MNDNARVSTFVGVPKTTTDSGGNPSVYLSPELLLAPTQDVQTFSRPTSPAATPRPTGSSSKEDTSASTSATSSKSDSSDSPAAAQKSTNVAAIAGGTAAGVAALFALGVGGWIYRRKYIRKKERDEHHKEELQLLTMQIDGTYLKKDINDSTYFAGSRGRGSFTDDLASMYTGGTLTRNHSSLQYDAHSSISASPMCVGVELTMDSQGRHGLPDGSPLIIDSIKPERTMKVSDKYADLEWFPLITSQSILEHHSGPSYVEDKELIHVAASAQKQAGLKGTSPVGILHRKD
ncbi:hypothetical protein IWW57_002349 [Coemansia sp. S610]|nr:hypothetical protein IWW57_002349 [Coemansia sp. S610]KAJ2412807.1 hypothetical protein GGI10_003465 [Coemansia sp. RSA 2530]KAJ2694660.1 hypothetical protein H4218_005515 [Coemansia sp. IMI 209128]